MKVHGTKRGSSVQVKGESRKSPAEQIAELAASPKEDEMKNASTKPLADPVTKAMREQPGRWIAWNEARRTVLATADTYEDALRQAAAADDPEPEIAKAPGIQPAVAARPFTLLEGESDNVIEDVKKIIPDSDEWLDTPNTSLWLEKPRDLIGTERERQLRYLLRGIRNGITT